MKTEGGGINLSRLLAPVHGVGMNILCHPLCMGGSDMNLSRVSSPAPCLTLRGSGGFMGLESAFCVLGLKCGRFRGEF